MPQKIPLNKILFLDIETVSQKPDFEELAEPMQKLWERKAKYLRKNEETPAELYDRAAIFAEFGKIICISVGIITQNNKETGLRLKSFYDKDEKKLLFAFRQLLVRSFNGTDTYLCGHNGKEFDFPYIARRMLVNSISLPAALDIAGKKPWEVRHIDTMELWKFGDYKHFTSLNLLTNIFEIPTPKDDIDGSMVGKVFWEDDDLMRIVKYCEKDVAALTQLYMRLNSLPLIPEENIISVE